MEAKENYGTIQKKEVNEEISSHQVASKQSEQSFLWIWLALLGGVAFGISNFFLGQTTIYSPIKVKLYMGYGMLA